MNMYHIKLSKLNLVNNLFKPLIFDEHIKLIDILLKTLIDYIDETDYFFEK